MSPNAAGIPRRTAGTLAAIAILALLATFALTAASARAAIPLPSVTTDSAGEVTFDTATLHGALTPHGSDTSYYFQFGLTTAYGSQTTIADAGAGTANVNVALPITGLQPLTVYHYRLVAVNATGAATGKDKTLLTTKIPLSLQILTSPNPVLYGGMISVQGALSGTENGNREVVLQANQFPFTAGFQNVAVNPELTSATGGFSFLLPGLTQVTQFRVVTSTNPAVISPVATENVAVRVTGHLGRARRRHFARVYGTVTPAENGMKVAILRIAHGHGVLVGGTVLVHATATSSRFSRVVPVKPGVYRVLVQVTNGAQVSNYSQPLQIR
jgi:hypothetical protein